MSDNAALIQALLERVDELESRAALRDLASDYCIGFDDHDWKRFIAIWHRDAVWDIGPPFGAFGGHAGIHRAVHDVLYPFWRETHHLSTNLTVAFSDADHATGRCDVDCMGAAKDDVVQMVGATYFDVFERRNGTWKIAHRRVKIHFFNAMPGLVMSPPAT
jgi:3-phenylpropionate/cinnamic acid dioxygenase small subunit